MAKLNYDNKKSLESQKKIYKALRQVLLRKPLCDITVTDIKDECNISRSTFYRNFKNIIDVLDVIHDFFYARYLRESEKHENKLLYFFEYWNKHKDLVGIIATSHEDIIKKCYKKYSKIEEFSDIYFDIKFGIITSLLCRWSKTKIETPEEMEKLTREILNEKCLDIVLNK